MCIIVSHLVTFGQMVEVKTNELYRWQRISERNDARGVDRTKSKSQNQDEIQTTDGWWAAIKTRQKHRNILLEWRELKMWPTAVSNIYSLAKRKWKIFGFFSRRSLASRIVEPEPSAEKEKIFHNFVRFSLARKKVGEKERNEKKNDFDDCHYDDTWKYFMRNDHLHALMLLFAPSSVVRHRKFLHRSTSNF